MNDLSNIPTKELATCLNQDWASAVSSIWKGTEQPSWEAAINELARIKIQFRTHLGFGYKACIPIKRIKRRTLRRPI